MAKAISLTFSNGMKVPNFGLGTWKSKPGEVQKAVKFALLEAGYRHIDCAYVYCNQKEVGEALKEVFASGKLKRSDVFITSKCWNTFHPREKVMENLKMILSELELEYLDLYLIHWPMGYKEGPELFPMENNTMLFSDVDYLETWKGMEDCCNSGMAKSIGVSNFNSVQLNRLLENCTIKPVMNQIEVHPYLVQTELIDYCKKQNILVTAYSPLGSSDRPWAKPEDPSLLEESKIKEIAKKHNKTSAQVLLRYPIQRGLIVIPKSVTPARIKENIDIFDFELSKEEMDIIASFNRGWRACGLEHVKSHPYFPFSAPF